MDSPVDAGSVKRGASSFTASAGVGCGSITRHPSISWSWPPRQSSGFGRCLVVRRGVGWPTAGLASSGRRRRTMDTTVVAERRVGWLAEITRYQWLVLFVAWAGWALDAADFNLFSLVLRPAVTELLGGGQVSAAQLGLVGGILSPPGLLGWALGGVGFGILAAYIGPGPTLPMS